MSEVELQLVDHFGLKSESWLWGLGRWIEGIHKVIPPAAPSAYEDIFVIKCFCGVHLHAVIGCEHVCVCVCVCVCACLVEIWMVSFIQLEYKSSSLNCLRVLFKFPVISPSWTYAHSFSKFCKENCWILCDIYHNSENLCCFLFPFLPPLFPFQKHTSSPGSISLSVTCF